MTTITSHTTTQHNAVAQETSQRQRVDKVLRQISAEEGAVTAPQPTADLVEPVKRINQVMRRYGVEFELHRESSQVVTRIIDRENGDVIRQIPSEEMLRIAQRLDDIVGRLIALEV